MSLFKSIALFVLLIAAITSAVVVLLIGLNPEDKAIKQYASTTHMSCAPIVMYSLSYCPACKVKKQEMKKKGLKFTAHEINKHTSYKKVLMQKAAAAGWPSGNIGMPVIEIKNKLYHSSISVEEIKDKAC